MTLNLHNKITYRYDKLVNFPNSTGIEPFKPGLDPSILYIKVSQTYKLCSLVKFPISAGMGPLRVVLAQNSPVISDPEQITPGIVQHAVELVGLALVDFPISWYDRITQQH